VLTVTPVNDAPTLSGLSDQTTAVSTPVGPLNFTVNDLETAAGSLSLLGGSSNPTLVPNANIAFGGSGSNRTVTVTPVAGLSGTVTITLVVSDGGLTATNRFAVNVGGLLAGTRSFTNSTVITIPGVGNATPYPSIITVSNLGGTVSNVSVTLRSLSHTWANDIDVLLVSPTGQKVLIMSDCGGGRSISGITLTLSDAASSVLSSGGQLVTGTFKPTDYSPADSFGAPAPAGPYALVLSAFNGQAANGAWSLYALDDGAKDQGGINAGWILTVTTGGVFVPAGGGSASSLASSRVFMSKQATGWMLSIEGLPDHRYVIEASDDLSHWVPVREVTSSTGLSFYPDVNLEMTNRTRRFYRVAERD
jgi:subtilisin-like proprotein convertase family protein